MQPSGSNHWRYLQLELAHSLVCNMTLVNPLTAFEILIKATSCADLERPNSKLKYCNYHGLY